MKERIEQLGLRIDAMSLRERGLLFLAIVAVLIMLSQALLFTPLNRKQKNILARIGTLQQQASASEATIQAVLKRQSADPNAENRRLQQQLDAQLASLNQEIAGKVQGLIAPQQMAKVLEAVLEHQSGLKLLHVENLPSEPLVQPPKGKENTHVGIYKHGVKLELEGDYMSALAYLRALQALPWVLYWDQLKITTDKYPRAHIVIVVHTLSLDEGWIGV